MKYFLVALLMSTAIRAQSQEEVLLKGLYLSFDEYITNAPKGTDRFNLEKFPRKGSEWAGTESITVRLDDSNRKVSNIWGFTFENKVYISHQQDFFPIEIVNDSIIFFGFGVVTKDDWYTGEYQNPADAKRAKANAIDRARLEKHKYLIHPETGNITRVPTKSELAELMANSMEIVIYRLSKKQKDSSFVITVNDANPTICYLGTVHNYLISPEMNGATICLNDDDHTCIDIPFNQKIPQYIKASLGIDDKIASLKHVKRDLGEWESEQILSDNKRSQTE